jgi:imidazolonepropionase-like amidohydrolase
MTRTVLRGARIFDGTGADPADGDIAIESGRIVGVGTDLDGDEAVELRGKTILPGFFDCHTHVTVSGVDLWQIAQQPFSYQFFQAVKNLEATLRIGITTVRDAGGADLGIKEAVADGLVPGPRMQISIIMLSQTGGHGDNWYPSGGELPFFMAHPGRPAGLVDGPDEVRRKVREVAG